MKKNEGFSLIELMIAVAILGIIVSIAYPSYLSYLRDSRRADAEGVLIEMSQWMERQYTVNGRYDDGAGNAPNLPIDKSPRDGDATFYEIDVTAIDDDSFTLTATAIGSQTEEECGNLTLTQTGARGSSGPGTRCWDD
ncbi:type IV pilin protein [Neptuniibacter sp. QD72_48]|uniref:type IV pilin protein n=1 Tax=unclassified Neptuniibacter TaxID=2630693 RepID=UPI0039F4DB23